MKKIGLICAAALIGLTLTACGSSSSQKSTKSSSSSSTKAIKKHKTAKHSKQEKKKQSSISSASSSSSQAQSTAQQNDGSQQTMQVSQSSNSNNSSVNSNAPSNINNFNGDIHDFVNAYGETMAAYKIDHGMSVKDALYSTPDNMKTSGEMQDQYMYEQGKDPQQEYQNAVNQGY
ncbi:hypothetical protein [Limosilactobacillus allomucosae]|uniref:Lipoprotein n=2 Tax=Limosilactobacillus allomucosae TaxID=3142938 RepID=A0ABV0I5H5_9LACO